MPGIFLRPASRAWCGGEQFGIRHFNLTSLIASKPTRHFAEKKAVKKAAKKGKQFKTKVDRV
jgi:hypothetical protein